MPTRLDLDPPDLSSDPGACAAVKDERVAVSFAASDGVLASAVGSNAYRAGDALVTGSTGDRWTVSRARFDAKYRPDGGQRPGEAGPYRNLPQPVLAKRMAAPFRIARCAGGDLLTGEAGDWLLQYAPGDYGVVERARFERVYQLL
jgi:hypothetical protein